MTRNMKLMLIVPLLAAVVACGGGGGDPTPDDVSVQVFEGEVPESLRSQFRSTDAMAAAKPRERAQLCKWICGAFTPLNQMAPGLAMTGTAGSLFFTGDTLQPNAFYGTQTAPATNIGAAIFPGSGEVFLALPEVANWPAGSAHVWNNNATHIIYIDVYVYGSLYSTMVIYHNELELRPDGRYYFPTYRGRINDF